MVKVAGIIPARYGSSRFPGKPLALLGGKPVIQHVWERVRSVLDEVVIATDDIRIADAAEAFGAKATLTSASHRSGTDRCAEAAAATDADIIINIQGDEPFVDPRQIHTLIKCFDHQQTDIATIVRRYQRSEGLEGLMDPNLVKVVVDNNDKALYFSRSVIPYIRGVAKDQWPISATYYVHIGIYAFRRQVLQQISRLESSPLEQAESLEQLRWLQNGFTIRVGYSEHKNIGIDTPTDLLAAERLLKIHAYGN